MFKSKLAIAIDSIIISILSFIIFFFVFKRFIKNAIFLIFLCILLSLCLFVMIFRLFLRKYHLNTLSFKESKHMINCIESLKFSHKKEIIFYFENLFNCKYLNSDFYENDKFIYFINLRIALNPTNFFDAFDIYFSKQKPIIFICENYDENFKKLIEQKKDIFYIFTPNDLYTLMKHTNSFPIDVLPLRNFKQNIKDKLSKFVSSISKKHFKDYLFSGLSLITLSLFIPFSFYYSLFGIFLLFLSILCLIKNKTATVIHNTKHINLIDTIKK